MWGRISGVWCVRVGEWRCNICGCEARVVWMGGKEISHGRVLRSRNESTNIRKLEQHYWKLKKQSNKK